MARETVVVLDEYDSKDTLKALLVDNIRVNTGADNGLIICLENILGRKLHNIGCSLYQNELPLRAVFRQLNGVIKSRTNFTGPLGKLCAEIHQQVLVDFQRMIGLV